MVSPAILQVESASQLGGLLAHALSLMRREMSSPGPVHRELQNRDAYGLRRVLGALIRHLDLQMYRACCLSPKLEVVVRDWWRASL